MVATPAIIGMLEEEGFQSEPEVIILGGEAEEIENENALDVEETTEPEDNENENNDEVSRKIYII